MGQVIEFTHVRSLPTYETMNWLLARFQVASDSAEALIDAMKAESGLNDASNKTRSDGVGEYDAVQEIVGILNLFLNAKVEYNGKESFSTHPPATIDQLLSRSSSKLQISLEDQEILPTSRRSSWM